MTTFQTRSNNNNNNNNNDYSKKEEFRRYLEKTGVIDALTKVLVGLYEEPERPPHALEYVKKYLDVSSHTANTATATAVSTLTLTPDLEALKRENEELKRQNESLKKELLKQQQQLQTTTTTKTIK